MPVYPQSTSPRLGLGCVTFGREIDRSAAFAMMDHALQHDLTHFDTAAAYGAGASETIIGAWLEDRGAREQIVLATKLLPPFEPAAIEASLAASLRRLDQPSVDILYLHRWDESVMDPDVLRTLDGLVRGGRAKTLGASNFSAVQLRQALDRQQELGVARFQTVQTIHNYAVRSVDAELRAVCARNRVAIVGYSPLGAGFLTGKHQHGVAPGSRFEVIPGHQRVYFHDLAWRRLSCLQEAAVQSGVPMARLALAWALHQPQIETVLVGGRSPAHLDQALEARACSNSDLLRALDCE